MAQEIYLSPRNIINHLRVIETKIPRNSFSLYSSLISPLQVNEDVLAAETRQILAFAGLEGYQADVHIAKLEDGVGGYIHLGDPAERAVHINIKESLTQSWKACVACLAHEVCHKVLQVHGLNFPNETMTEVYTDLTTIYLGFGRAILDGYITDVGAGKQFLGYLQFDTYKVTNLLVCVLYGQMSGKEAGHLTTDIFAEDAVTLWESEKDHTALLRRIFMQKGRQGAELLKNISLMEQMLKHCKSGLLHQVGQLEKEYMPPTLQTEQRSNVLTMFSISYDYCVNNQEEGALQRDPKADKLNKSLSDALFEMFLAYNDINRFEFSYSVFCPFCGNVFQDPRAEGETVIETCPECRHRFIYDGTRWNPTIRQRELNEEKAERERQFYEQVRSQVNDATWKLRKDSDYENARARVEANKMVEEIRKNEQQRCKDSIRERLPWFLKPFVKKYLA